MYAGYLHAYVLAINIWGGKLEAQLARFQSYDPLLIHDIFMKHLYRLRMRADNVFILSVCLSVQAITFECLDVETSFWYGGTS